MPTRLIALLVLACSLVAGTAAAQPAGGKKDDLELQAAEHYKQGRNYYDAGNYEKALSHFTAAQALAPRPLLNYHLARCHQGLGNKVKALQLYQQFVDDDPTNKIADDARTQIALLAAEIAASKPVTPGGDGSKPVDPFKITDDPGKTTDPIGDPGKKVDGPGGDLVDPALTKDPEPRRDTPKPSKRNRMIWLAAGVAAIAAGVALDTLPGSADNGSVDGLDFAPVGLYGLGVTGLVLGVF